jgi:hypothetical protein
VAALNSFGESLLLTTPAASAPSGKCGCTTSITKPLEMKALVARRPSASRQPQDVWSAMHGEIVVAPYVCEDRDCVCGRVQQGIISHGYSTEVQVVETDTSIDALVSACQTHLGFSQWAAVVGHPSELDVVAADLVDDMRDAAGRFPVGTVLKVGYEHGASNWHYVER